MKASQALLEVQGDLPGVGFRVHGLGLGGPSRVTYNSFRPPAIPMDLLSRSP